MSWKNRHRRPEEWQGRGDSKEGECVWILCRAAPGWRSQRVDSLHNQRARKRSGRVSEAVAAATFTLAILPSSVCVSKTICRLCFPSLGSAPLSPAAVAPPQPSASRARFHSQASILHCSCCSAPWRSRSNYLSSGMNLNKTQKPQSYNYIGAHRILRQTEGDVRLLVRKIRLRFFFFLFCQ